MQCVSWQNFKLESEDIVLAVENIIMPKLGESVTEGTISRWLVQSGTFVNKYDPIAEVMTDKVNAEIPSSFTGTIEEILAEEGETLPVGAVICTIRTEETQKNSDAMKNSVITDTLLTSTSLPELKTRYSPAVLKLSQEHNVDLSKVTGTGRGGRITRKDILAIIENRTTLENAQTGVMAEQTSEEKILPIDSPSSEYKSETGHIEIPVSNIRKTIANKMVKSKAEIPHAWMMIEVDVTDMVNYRNSIKEEFRRREGFNITYFAFFVKAVAQALKEFPMMNSMWAGDKIIQKREVNISIAVAAGDELFVPVIKNADEKSIKGIAREIAELAQKARSGKLTTEDMEGGTFTINNTGSFGSIQSIGIINYPQAAILQVESIVKRPVVINNAIAIRDMVNLCLSLDHRILDGLICGQFMQRIKEILENIPKNISVY